jgi:hypothetical protein
MTFYHIPDGGPAISAEAVTANDSTVLEPFRALYVGTGGDVVVTVLSGSDITFANVQDGSILPVGGTKVKSTSTTASDIVALR